MVNTPLYAIVHERSIPVESVQAREIATIKKTERWISVHEDLSIDPAEIQEEGPLYVCGATLQLCVNAHFNAVKEARGPSKITSIYRLATVSIAEVDMFG